MRKAKLVKLQVIILAWITLSHKNVEQMMKIDFIHVQECSIFMA